MKNTKARLLTALMLTTTTASVPAATTDQIKLCFSSTSLRVWAVYVGTDRKMWEIDAQHSRCFYIAPDDYDSVTFLIRDQSPTGGYNQVTASQFRNQPSIRIGWGLNNDAITNCQDIANLETKSCINRGHQEGGVWNVRFVDTAQ